MDYLMRALLATICELSPVRYIVILERHAPVRPCKVSNSLRRLQARGLITYDAGEYTITDKGRGELWQS